MEASMHTVTFSTDFFEGTGHCLVFAVGYEDRSCQIACKLLPAILSGSLKVLPFLFKDYTPTGEQAKLLANLESINVLPVVVAYEEHQRVVEEVEKFVMLQECEEDITLHIDYSSMPRSWYCRFPQIVSSQLKNGERACLWYSIGEYKPAKEGFPSTGVRDIRVFSGRASLRAENKRTHLLGLGFDHIRMQGIMSVLDPSYFGVCYAYPVLRPDIKEKVRRKNAELINSAQLSIELQLQDVPFMVSKLADVARMLVAKGDVIFVPDGPKPLTLACSLVPSLLNKVGVLCLHVKRHEAFFEPINVFPTGEIIGFLMYGDTIDGV